MARIHILLDEGEKERFRREADREGVSLGEWLRDAARAKLAAADRGSRLDNLGQLRDFFAECDAREQRPEPEWAEHRRVIEASIRAGGTAT
jgi:hypothetical protein